MIKIDRILSEEEKDRCQGRIIDMAGGFFLMAGGFFLVGMRWKDYLQAIINPDPLTQKWSDKMPPEYAEAFREYILENKLWESSEWCSEHTPLFTDGITVNFSSRAWGDLLAATWSEHLDRDYSYINFYGKSWLLPKPKEITEHAEEIRKIRSRSAQRQVILSKLEDLLKQATEERSHFYVGSVVRETLAYLKEEK